MSEPVDSSHTAASDHDTDVDSDLTLQHCDDEEVEELAIEEVSTAYDPTLDTDSLPLHDPRRYSHNIGQQIKPLNGLYLASYDAACHADWLKHKNIQQVLTVATGLSPAFSDWLSYKQLSIQDSHSATIYNHFDECYEYINAHLAAGTAVLVHCQAGISRSATIIVAYIMRVYLELQAHTAATQQQSSNDAAAYPSHLQHALPLLSILTPAHVASFPSLTFCVLDLVRNSRPFIEPNRNFMSQLHRYEQHLQQQYHLRTQSAATADLPSYYHTLLFSPALSVTFHLSPYPLTLRCPFGTSHSSTTTRTNALLNIKVYALQDSETLHSSSPLAALEQRLDATSSEAACTASFAAALNGYSEVGLPPQKTGCYEATYNDMYQHTVQFVSFAMQLLRQKQVDWDLTTFAELEARNTDIDFYDADQERYYCLYNAFTHTPNNYFQTLRTQLAAYTNDMKSLDSGSAQRLSLLCFLFYALDQYYAAACTSSTPLKRSTYRTFKCLMELCIMDLWGYHNGTTVCELMGTPFQTVDIQPRSFYTVGLDTIPAMLDNLRWGLTYTPLIKIKINDDVAQTKQILAELYKACEEHRAAAESKMGQSLQDVYKWAIDANAAWTEPQTAMQFLDVLKPYAHMIVMLEQPFTLYRALPEYVERATDVQPHQLSVVVNGEYVPFTAPSTAAHDDATCIHTRNFVQWQQIKAAYEAIGIHMYGDESITSVHDVQQLHSIMHGVNIKLEKAGGYREALKILDLVKQKDMKLWIGCMVGSVVRYIHLPAADVDTQLLQDAARRAQRTESK